MASSGMRFPPGDLEAAKPTIDGLARRFETWVGKRHSQIDGSEASDLQMLLEHKVRMGDGRLDEWSPADLDEFVLQWCPRQVSAAPTWASTLVESIAQGLEFLGEQGLLSPGSGSAADLAAYSRSLRAECERRLGDPSYFGMGKSVFASIGGEFGEELTQEDLDDLMDRFNALPYEQRKAITDPAMSQPAHDLPTIGPVVMPSADDVRESAASAPILAVFRALCDYFAAPGRPLTKAGNIKLADAGALSQILGTESLEEDIGGHVWKRQSSARMPRLDLYQWWAREVGALRVVKGRMVGVASWRARSERDPLGEVRKAFDTLMDFGVISAWGFGNGSGTFLDDTVMALLSLCLTDPEPMEFPELLDRVSRLREQLGLEHGWEDPAFQRDLSSFDLDRMLSTLELAGVVVQYDVTYEPKYYGRIRVGGSFALTPFGVDVVVAGNREAGVEVVTIDAPQDLSADDLARMAAEQEVSVTGWMDLCGGWLDGQSDRRKALAALFDVMDTSTAMSVFGADVPDALVADFADVLRDLYEARWPSDPVAAVAFSWLQERGLIDDDSPQDAALRRLILVGLAAEYEPEAIDRYWAAGRPTPVLLEEVQTISRLMPANAEVLLEAIGRHYPEKTVAKSARRELLKVRSRRANAARP